MLSVPHCGVNNNIDGCRCQMAERAIELLPTLPPPVANSATRDAAAIIASSSLSKSKQPIIFQSHCVGIVQLFFIRGREPRNRNNGRTIIGIIHGATTPAISGTTTACNDYYDYCNNNTTTNNNLSLEHQTKITQKNHDETARSTYHYTHGCSTDPTFN